MSRRLASANKPGRELVWRMLRFDMTMEILVVVTPTQLLTLIWHHLNWSGRYWNRQQLHENIGCDIAFSHPQCPISHGSTKLSVNINCDVPMPNMAWLEAVGRRPWTQNMIRICVWYVKKHFPMANKQWLKVAGQGQTIQWVQCLWCR